MKKDPNKYPSGWSRARVESVIASYDRQTDAEAIGEADAAWVNAHVQFVAVPVEVYPKVRALINRFEGLKKNVAKRLASRPRQRKAA